MEQDITLNLKILIYGAGVIGSLYAVLFSKNKNTDVSVYARGKRLEELCENGLRYCDKDTVKVANVRIIDAVKDDDIYDYIFLTVRENQLYKALEELRVNRSQNIVTMDCYFGRISINCCHAFGNNVAVQGIKNFIILSKSME